MLREYLDRELIHVNEELDQLHPPFTGPPQSNLIQLCNSYTYEISKFAEGQKDYELFIQAATQVYSNLRKAISRSLTQMKRLKVITVPWMKVNPRTGISRKMSCWSNSSSQNQIEVLCFIY